MQTTSAPAEGYTNQTDRELIQQRWNNDKNEVGGKKTYEENWKQLTPNALTKRDSNAGKIQTCRKRGKPTNNAKEEQRRF